MSMNRTATGPAVEPRIKALTGETLGELLDLAAVRTPSSIALVIRRGMIDERWTYRQASQRSDRVAPRLRRAGGAPGEADLVDARGEPPPPPVPAVPGQPVLAGGIPFIWKPFAIADLVFLVLFGVSLIGFEGGPYFALGSRGAWLLEPYVDLPETDGLVLETVEDIEGTARVAVKHGFQVNTHAIGDRGVRETLDLYERVWDEMGVDGSGLRWRIEHSQHIDPLDVPRFGDNQVHRVMNPVCHNHHTTCIPDWGIARVAP